MQLESSDGSQPDWIVKSGVAARLAGIPVETLRVWERRHQITGGPIRQGAQRVYSRAQVERLTLVKRVV
ncbi:MAG: MerR family transcriptional regulator, partial [Proteobacteria bacterium]|nr:MerR family transcriptional regulator [Pseudomonadota bacterium]